MSTIDALPFARVVCHDFEFGGGPGERPDVRCFVGRELRSGRTSKLWHSDIGAKPPFPTDQNTLWIAYYASAEINCFLTLGWPLPFYMLDLFTEFRCLTNGLDPVAGNGLLGALTYFALDTIGASEKKEMRDLALRGGPYTHTEARDLLTYCEGDTDALARLLPRMLPGIRLDHALHRGRCMVASAHMEHAGVPIDMLGLDRVKANWESLKEKLVDEFDPHREIYDGVSFNNDKFASWLVKNGIGWPRLSDNPRYRAKQNSRPGQLDLEDETFRQMARQHPQLAKVHELRASLSKLRLNDLQIGKDGRNRTILSAFRARTGRNQPSNSKSIVGPARWIRGFIQPPEGYGLAYIDYSQQEFGIAAALSGDGNMIDAYTNERADPYLRFGILAGMLPEDATRKNPEHETVRSLCKMLVLAIQYGQSAEGMAQRSGMAVVLARDLMRRHRMTFPTFWRWSDRAVRQATLHNILHTAFGWPIHIAADFNPRSLRNFPMQANGAEMLRLACCLATERGIEVCMPVHDATFITAPLDQIDEDIAQMQACGRRRAMCWPGLNCGRMCIPCAGPAAIWTRTVRPCGTRLRVCWARAMSRKATDLKVMAVDVGWVREAHEHTKFAANGPTRPVQRWKFKKGFRIMPKAWAEALDTLPPNCHAVAHCLLRRRWRYGENRFVVGNQAFARVGLSRKTKLSTLRRLAAVGLITIDSRGTRKSPFITLHKLE